MIAKNKIWIALGVLVSGLFGICIISESVSHEDEFLGAVHYGLPGRGPEYAKKIVAFMEALHYRFGADDAVLIARSNVVEAEHGFGKISDETSAAIGPDTGFILGSLSKPFTAAAIFALEQTGKLATSGTVCSVIEEFCTQALQNIHLSHLLDHSSGLPRDHTSRWRNWAAVIFHEHLPDTWDPKTAIEIKLESIPGSQVSYSNLGYMILAEVITRVGGESYPLAMKHWVFEPLGCFDFSMMM